MMDSRSIIKLSFVVLIRSKSMLNQEHLLNKVKELVHNKDKNFNHLKEIVTRCHNYRSSLATDLERSEWDRMLSYYIEMACSDEQIRNEWFRSFDLGCDKPH